MQKKPLYICLLIILAGLMCWLIRPQSELALLSGGFLVFCGGLSLAVHLPKWRKNAGDMAVPLSLRSLLDTPCPLNWDELSKNIHHPTSPLLKP